MATKRIHICRTAWVKSLPIFFSYVFVSMAYGMTMTEAGFSWGYALAASLCIYTGAFQFVFVTFLSSGASLITIAFTALLMNSRQFFYGLTFVREFGDMPLLRRLYTIHTMTDETYAVGCTLQLPPEEKEEVMLGVAFLSRCYWMLGTVLGSVLGQLLPYIPEGIDFCMTALFIMIFMDQWEQAQSHQPAWTGLVVGILMLWIVGSRAFMLPSLVLTSCILLAMSDRKAAL